MIEQSNDFISFKYENKILYIKIKKSIPTDDEWNFSKDTMINYYEILKMSNTKMSLIFDIRNLGILKKNKCKEWGQLLHERKDITKEKIHKTSVICNNMIIRNMVNMFFSIYKPVRPIKIFKNEETAINFINDNIVKMENIEKIDSINSIFAI